MPFQYKVIFESLVRCINRVFPLGYTRLCSLRNNLFRNLHSRLPLQYPINKHLLRFGPVCIRKEYLSVLAVMTQTSQCFLVVQLGSLLNEHLEVLKVDPVELSWDLADCRVVAGLVQPKLLPEHAP